MFSRVPPGAGSGTGGEFAGAAAGRGGAATGGTGGTIAIIGAGGSTSGIGGSTGSGGVTGTGGSSGSGGVTGTGGVTGSGGVTGTGGSTGSGGILGAGGIAGTGGVTGTGGILGTGGVIGTGGTGGAGGVASSGGFGGSAGAGGTVGDTARYNFEADAQGWSGATDSVLTARFTTIARTTTQQFAGAAALAGTISFPAGGLAALVVLPPTPAIRPGTTVTYRVFVPVGSTVDWVLPYVQEIAPSYVFTAIAGGSHILTAANYGTWLAFNVVVPATALAIGTLGVQFHALSAWTGTVYLDSITW